MLLHPLSLLLSASLSGQWIVQAKTDCDKLPNVEDVSQAVFYENITPGIWSTFMISTKVKRSITGYEAIYLTLLTGECQNLIITSIWHKFKTKPLSTKNNPHA